MENFQYLLYLGWVSERQKEKGGRELFTGIENTAESIFGKMNILGIWALWNTQKSYNLMSVKKLMQKTIKHAQTSCDYKVLE